MTECFASEFPVLDHWLHGGMQVVVDLPGLANYRNPVILGRCTVVVSSCLCRCKVFVPLRKILHERLRPAPDSFYSSTCKPFHCAI